MNEYSILFSKRAKKDLSKIDKPIRHTIALTGALTGYWRYRVGNYRIVAEIRDTEFVVIAVSIAHRSSVYEKL